MISNNYTKININQLHPTQIAVGFEQVKEKEIKILEKNKEHLEKYLKNKIVPIIIGPNNVFYILDHHHLSKAIYNLNLKFVYYKIIDDFSNLNYNDFWNKMIEKKYIWLYDQKGNKLDLELFLKLLPNHVKYLKNDPYRSLAGIIRKKNGFNKDWTPFSEFLWANFFRNMDLNLNYEETNISKNIIKKALNISKSDIAKNLPGFIEK